MKGTRGWLRLQRAKESITVIMNSPWSPGEILFAGAFMHEIPSSHPNSNKQPPTSTFEGQIYACLDLWKRCQRIKIETQVGVLFSPETISKVDDIKIKRKVSPFFLPLFPSLPSFVYFLPVSMAWRKRKSSVKSRLNWNRVLSGRFFLARNYLQSRRYKN